MGQVVVSIAGKSFRLACEDGDEDRLAALAQTFDATVRELRDSFGEIGDTRLAVMAGLVMTDRVGDAQEQIEHLTAEVQQLRQALAAAQIDQPISTDALRARLEDMASRIEALGSGQAGG
ncbi:MAG: cell division protein ZapA [Devosiaceae bacterium]|nr:cell division protein ZapA [Devosiaceae bacterium MH13]